MNDHSQQRRLLFTVFLINALLFIAEMFTGILSHSLGLVADSLDMFADATVYGLSYYAVGHILEHKKMIARLSGLLQLTLAIVGLVEVLRRFFQFEELPGFAMMMGMSLVALAGNVASMYFLKKAKSQEAHFQASVIFTNNDILANIGVIIAGGLVYFTRSKFPDLIIGLLVFLLVARGAIRILRISR